MQHKDDSVLEAKKAKVKLPPMYKVLLLNDDYTPMEFVVLVLQKFFAMTRERATQVMLKVLSARRRLHQGSAGRGLFAQAPASAAMRDGGNVK